MDPFTFTIVLASAFAHAVMNCALKRQSDPLAATLMLAICGGMVATPLLMMTGTPGIEALPYLLASVLVHIFYWTYLGRAYATGEVSVVFPLARGVAPILTLGVAVLFIGETTSTGELALIAVIVAGIFLVMCSGVDGSRLWRQDTFANALIVAVTICLYTVIDGLGTRRTGNAAPYVVMLYACNGWVLLIYGLARQRERLAAALDAGWRTGVVTGTMSLAIYGVALWAMTRAPIPLVAALRETSVMFAAILAVLWLREPMRVGRMVGAGVIVAGVAFVKMS
jgi:drug/metabolite transporter (DMT)-like permease